MSLLNETYGFLKLNGLVKNQEDFSKRFLHKSPRYFSMLKASGKRASVEALATLAARLQDVAQTFSYLGESKSAARRASMLANSFWSVVNQRALLREPHLRGGSCLSA